VLLLLSVDLFNFDSAPRAKGVTSAKSLPTLGAGQLQTGFQVLDGYSASAKVDIFHSNAQGFADAAAEVEQQTNQQPVPKVGGRLLHLSYLAWFNVSLHYFISTVI
jgi:hypothetical protein